jgi:arylsulfatase
MHDRGFDHYWGLRGGAGNYFNPGERRSGEGEPARKRIRTWCFDERVLTPFTPPERDFYTTDYTTNWALELLRRYRGEDRPFFLYMAYTAPHDPLQAWPEDIARYRGRYDAGFDAVRQARYERQQQSDLMDDTTALSAPTHEPWASLPQAEKEDQARRMEVYGAMVDRLDQNIGRLLDWLRETGQEDNTLILFASDNGASAENVALGDGEIGSMTRWASLQGNWANVCNTPFRLYKNHSFEGGICTPMIASWPAGIARPGRVSHRVGHFVDLMPTLLELAQGSYPATFSGKPILPMAGESFASIFQGGKETGRRSPVFFEWGGGRAVIRGDWKLIAEGNGDWELYHITEDRTETVDLAAGERKRVVALFGLWAAWRERCRREAGAAPSRPAIEER